MNHPIPAVTDSFVTLTAEGFRSLPIEFHQVLQCGGIETWVDHGWVKIALSLPEFNRLLQMFWQPQSYVTFSGTAGEA